MRSAVLGTISCHHKHDIVGISPSSERTWPVKFCHWVRITSVLHFIKPVFITNLQSIPPLLKHIFVTFLPSREKQINSLSGGGRVVRRCHVSYVTGASS